MLEYADSADMDGAPISSRPSPLAGLRRILRFSPSSAGSFWFLAVAIWGAWCLHFGTVGNHFGTSGATWGTMGAAGWTQGSPKSDFQ